MSGQAEESFNTFMKYIGTVMGKLSSASPLFPFATLLLKMIPVYGEASTHTGFASLCSSVLVWFIYLFRIDIARMRARKTNVISIIAFISGSIMFLDYRNLIYENPPMPDFGPRNRAFVEYCLMFGLWTGAFTLSAMYEYMHENPNLIRKYRRKEAIMDDFLNELTPETKDNMAPKLDKIIEEEIEELDE